MKIRFDTLEEQRRYERRCEIIEVLNILKNQARDSGANTFIWDVNFDGFNWTIENAIKELEKVNEQVRRFQSFKNNKN